MGILKVGSIFGCLLLVRQVLSYSFLLWFKFFSCKVNKKEILNSLKLFL